MRHSSDLDVAKAGLMPYLIYVESVVSKERFNRRNPWRFRMARGMEQAIRHVAYKRMIKEGGR